MKIRLTPSVLALLAANSIPIFGVLLFGWELFPLIFVYWLENAVIGMFTILKILSSNGRNPWKRKIIFVLFFLGHYSVFWIVHGVFVIELFGARGSTILQTYQFIVQNGPQYTLLALVLSHGYSFAYNYIRQGENKNVTLRGLMFAPYRRVIVLHALVLFGGIIIMILGLSRIGLLILALIKIAADLYAHGCEHARS